MRLLTNLLFEPKGMHNQNAAYSIKDTVMSADGSRVYFALQDVPAGTALDNEDYWKLQIDLSGSKSAMDQALASFGSCAKEIGMRVRGETAGASGNPVTFLPDAGSLLQPVTVLEPQQQGSGDPSPSNIRPIIGCDKLDLGATGKNLFNLNQTYDSFIDSIITGDVITTTFRSNGALHIKEGDVHPAGAYTLSIVPVSGLESFIVWLYYADNDEEKEISRFNSTNLSAAFIADRPFKIGFSGIYRNPEHVCSYKVQLELGSAPSTYESHQDKAYTVQLGQTVYGGRFDWLTGKLVAEWTVRSFDGTNANWRMTQYSNLCAWLDVPELEWSSTFYSSHFKCYNSITGEADGTIGVAIEGASSVSFGLFFGVKGIASTVDEWNAYLSAQKVAGTPVQIAYKLANPIEIQLTPHIITAADPEQTNTLYGDGRIDVEYVKPLHVSIEEHGSEGEYELIETIVCDGTYDNLKRTNLALSHAKIYFHMQAAEAAANVVIESNNDAGLFGYAVIPNGINTGERWSNVYLVSDGKNAYCESVNAVNSINGATSVNKTASRKDASTPINRISIYTGGNKMLPAGSTIEIWGVRANA